MKIKTFSLLRRIACPAAASTVLSILAFPLATAGTTPPFTDANWVSMGGLPGANGEVYATVLDGLGNLYVGGNFSTIGNTAAGGIAKWDGTNWTALGSGMGGSVYALALSGNALYAGGYFNIGASYHVGVAKWDGTNWSTLGSGVDFEDWSGLTAVYALAVSGSDLYAAGRFTRAGGVAASQIAKWNGSSWSPLGTGIAWGIGPNGVPIGWVSALAIVGSDLYAGGYIWGAGGVGVSGIAKWNGSAWSALGSGVGGANPYVHSLAASGTDLYVGGQFEMAGGITARHVAKWNGSAWSALGAGPGGLATYALAISGGVLHAGGIGPSTVDNWYDGWVRRWNGSSWIIYGQRIDSPVTSLAVTSNGFYAGGLFTSIGGSPAHSIARWNGSWSVPGRGHGLDGAVRALATSGNNLFVGGEFVWANGIQVNRITRWNGTNWLLMGPGFDHDVNALAVAGDSLYALGTFTNAGSTRVNGFARWNGATWSAFGGGRNPGSLVRVMAAIGNSLYVGGNFTSIGGNAISNLARWNGSSWSSVGGGVNGEVYGLAASETDLCVHGAFTTAGGNPANRIAKWNGSTWSPLGTGVPGGSPAVSGNDVYVVGAYTGVWKAIFKWDGTNWNQLPFLLGAVSDIRIDALAAIGSELYIGGSFDSHSTLDFNNGGRANYIAKWDGSSFSVLGSGMNAAVHALLISGNTLYAGGDFTIAGGKASAFLAKANLPVAAGQFESWTYSPATGLNWTFTGGTVGRPYRVQTSTSLAPGSWIDFTNFTYTAPAAIRDSSAISGSNRFFRAVSP